MLCQFQPPMNLCSLNRAASPGDPTSSHLYNTPAILFSNHSFFSSLFTTSVLPAKIPLFNPSKTKINNTTKQSSWAISPFLPFAAKLFKSHVYLSTVPFCFKLLPNTSSPQHSTKTVPQGHQWPPGCWIQWSIPSCHLTWSIPSSWHNSSHHLHNLFFTWKLGHVSVLVFP